MATTDGNASVMQTRTRFAHRQEVDMAGKPVSVALAAVLLVFAGPASARGPWRAYEGNTTGWHLMSPEERVAHQAMIRGFRSYEECNAYQVEHHKLMAARVSEQGLQLPRQLRDFCGHLRPRTSNR